MRKDSIEDILYAMQQNNLVYNHNFKLYSNKSIENTVLVYNHPDGWIYKDPGASGEIGFDESTDSCLIQKSTDNSEMTFSQFINEFPRWKDMVSGKKITASVIIENPISAKTDFNINFYLTDGISTSNKIIPFESGSKKRIDVELFVSESAENVEIGIKSVTPKAIIYINKVFANVGELALENLPCVVQGIIGERKQYIATEFPPSGELSLCEEAAELSNNYTRLNSVLNYRFGKGSNGNSLLIDMRGYFSRAWDNGANNDPDAGNRTPPGKGIVKGDHVSTFENDIFKKHDHGLNFSTNSMVNGGTAGAVPIININANSRTNVEADGLETRPKNIAELYTIKWA